MRRDESTEADGGEDGGGEVEAAGVGGASVLQRRNGGRSKPESMSVCNVRA